MIITTPVTDYIPASLLTTDGDIVRRGVADPERLARAASWSALISGPAAGQPSFLDISVAIDQYLKSTGGATIPTWQSLALRDTGIHIGGFSRSTAGDLVISDIGFKISTAILFSHDGVTTNLNSSFGFDDGSEARCMYTHTDGVEHAHVDVHSIKIVRDGSNSLAGYISDIGDTSVTFTFAVVGTCNVHTIYLCLP